MTSWEQAHRILSPARGLCYSETNPSPNLLFAVILFL
jgi:hypothetical protein